MVPIDGGKAREGMTMGGSHGEIAATEAQEKFCPQCGKSCLPLKVPHISDECKECGRTVHFIRRGENGEGIHIRKGERFVMPAGFIQISLDPSSNGRLARAGLPFLLNRLFLSRTPKKTDDIAEFAARLDKEFDLHLANCEPLRGLDLQDPRNADEIQKRMESAKESRDWYIMYAGLACAALQDAVAKGAAGEAAHAGYLLGTLRALSIVTEPVFEQTLWRGYLANIVVYEAAAASHTPGEAEAIKQLGPMFERLPEATLYAFVESGLPIGPRIGVKSMPEELLRALASWHLATLRRKREEDQQAAKDDAEALRQRKIDAREDRMERIKWITVGMTAMGGVWGAVKAFGWF